MLPKNKTAQNIDSGEQRQKRDLTFHQYWEEIPIPIPNCRAGWCRNALQYIVAPPALPRKTIPCPPEPAQLRRCGHAVSTAASLRDSSSSQPQRAGTPCSHPRNDMTFVSLESLVGKSAEVWEHWQQDRAGCSLCSQQLPQQQRKTTSFFSNQAVHYYFTCLLWWLIDTRREML